MLNFEDALFVKKISLCNSFGYFYRLIIRVLEKITLQSIALRFRLDLVDLIGLDRKRSLSYTEDSDSAREDRTKHVLSLSKGWTENEMRE